MTGCIDKSLYNTTKVLKGKNILEIGCGGGFLTEALARLNATMTGVDPGENIIRIANLHLTENSPELQSRINYVVDVIENHSLDNQEKYDAVIVSEVIEHINDKTSFLGACVATLKKGGSIFITTPNRTNLSYLTTIVAAEDIFKFVPKNTHDWNKFISPHETQRILEECMKNI